MLNLHQLRRLSSSHRRHLVGYVYFDVFNQHYLQQPTLRSQRFSAMTGEEPVKMRCLSFWFSAFGRGDNSVLSVHAVKFEDTEGGSAAGSPGTSEGTATGTGTDGEKTSDRRVLLWSIQSRFLETRRNLWYYAQTAVNAETEYQVNLVEFIFLQLYFQLPCHFH